jgi:hypothetical protein
MKRSIRLIAAVAAFCALAPVSATVLFATTESLKKEHYTQAHSYSVAGDHGQAAREYFLCHEVDSSDVAALYLRAHELSESGQHQEAFNQYLSAFQSASIDIPSVCKNDKDCENARFTSMTLTSLKWLVLLSLVVSGLWLVLKRRDIVAKAFTILGKMMMPSALLLVTLLCILWLFVNGDQRPGFSILLVSCAVILLPSWLLSKLLIGSGKRLNSNSVEITNRCQCGHPIEQHFNFCNACGIKLQSRVLESVR